MTLVTINLTLTTRVKHFVHSYCDYYTELLLGPNSNP